MNKFQKRERRAVREYMNLEGRLNPFISQNYKSYRRKLRKSWRDLAKLNAITAKLSEAMTDDEAKISFFKAIHVGVPISPPGMEPLIAYGTLQGEVDS